MRSSTAHCINLAQMWQMWETGVLFRRFFLRSGVSASYKMWRHFDKVLQPVEKERNRRFRRPKCSHKNVFVEGCTSLWFESIKIHEKSSYHLKASAILAAKSRPEHNLAFKIITFLNKGTLEKLSMLFRTRHAQWCWRKANRYVDKYS